jgi:hypothetical protein
MSKDLLSEATRALREAAPVSEFEARATRARVMTGLHQTRVRRRTRLAFLLPIAASFVAVSAWGAASGRARVVLQEMQRWVGVTVNAPSDAKAPRRIAAPPATAAPRDEQALVAPPPPTEPAPDAPSVDSAAIPTRASASASASSGRAERDDPTLALYRAAHAAHFVDRDPARALVAWDAYLRAAPHGEFAPEARYNRALALVRLGRNQEAKSALEPFANGAYGAYRKSEASALLEHLGP